MRNIFIFTLIVSLLSLPSWSETLTINDLVTRNNLYYKKFTDTPFTGEILGIEEGKFRKGKRTGFWGYYYKNGELMKKGNYKDGKDEGLWEYYYKSGQIKIKENYKDGKQDGRTDFFKEDGSLEKTEIWKDGVKQE